jgi:hypothetical protein
LEHHFFGVGIDWRIVLAVHDSFDLVLLDVQASTRGGLNV